MTILTIIGFAAGMIGFIAMVASAVVVARSGAQKAALETWRGEAEAQKARADRQEQDLHDLAARVDRLEVENKRLGELASGAAAVADLKTWLSAQHAETLTEIRLLRSGGREAA